MAAHAWRNLDGPFQTVVRLSQIARPLHVCP